MPVASAVHITSWRSRGCRYRPFYTAKQAVLEFHPACFSPKGSPFCNAFPTMQTHSHNAVNIIYHKAKQRNWPEPTLQNAKRLRHVATKQP